VAQTGDFHIDSEELKAWINDGGTLVYLTPQNMHFIDFAGTPVVKGGLSIYKYGKGEIIAGDIDSISNKTLLRKRDSAYELYSEAVIKGADTYFNENHIYIENAETTLWDYVPLEGKFIVYQLVIVLAAFLYYKGKRFGKSVPYYEESERSENEYLYSAASLYRQARSYDLMVESYYHSLLRELHCSHEEFLECWERQKLSSIDKAQKVYEFVNRKEKTKKAKEYIQIVSILEQLRKIVRKRRDSYWKTLKKI
jgi:tetratricopeptide (TPR) repeat protein